MDFGQLACSDEEPDRWVERLVGEASKSRGLEVVLFAVVRYLGVKKDMWERAFSVLPLKEGTVLTKFERSFKEYVREDVPVIMPRRDFQAVMRSNPFEADLIKYCKVVSYLRKHGLSFAVTTQRVHAWRDPRQNPKNNHVLAAIAAFFGERHEFAMVEYCLVLDMPETLFRKALVPLSTLLPGPEAETDGPDDGASEYSSSSTQTMDISSSASSSSSRELPGSEDRTIEVSPPPPAKPVTPSLLRSTSSSSNSTFIKINHKSLSLSSSGHK